MNMAEVINECVSACRKMLLLPHLKVKTVLSCQDKSVIGKALKVLALQLHLSHTPLNNSFTVELQLNPHPDFTDTFHLSQWKKMIQCGVLDEPTVLNSLKTFTFKSDLLIGRNKH